MPVSISHKFILCKALLSFPSYVCWLRDVIPRNKEFSPTTRGLFSLTCVTERKKLYMLCTGCGYTFCGIQPQTTDRQTGTRFRRLLLKKKDRRRFTCTAWLTQCTNSSFGAVTETVGLCLMAWRSLKAASQSVLRWSSGMAACTSASPPITTSRRRSRSTSQSDLASPGSVCLAHFPAFFFFTMTS